MGVKKGNKKSPKSITFHKSALISDLDIKDFIFFYSKAISHYFGEAERNFSLPPKGGVNSRREALLMVAMRNRGDVV